jgi:Fe-S cluster assembly protein SufD
MSLTDSPASILPHDTMTRSTAQDSTAIPYREQLTDLLARQAKTAPDLLPFFRERRMQAMEAFERQGFPGRKHEEWKYTPVAHLTRTLLNGLPQTQTLQLPDAQVGNPDHTSAWLPEWNANRLVFVNGRFDAAASRIIDQGAFTLGSLAHAMVDQPDAVATWFDALQTPEWSAFALLNTALHQDGAWIHVQPGAAVPHPILIVDIAENLPDEAVLFPRHLLVAENGSSLRVVHRQIQKYGGSARLFSVLEAFVERQAVLELDTLQDGGRGVDAIGHVDVRQDRDSRFTSRTFCLQGHLIRNDLRVRFAGEHAECHLNGFYLAAEEDLVDNHLLIDHAVPHCQSNQLYKGIGTGRGSAVFNGKIFVRPNAQKTNAYQSNKNLLLSAEATINTKPQLEIFADDVKCSHGATSGQLDPESVFYLQARGIPEAAAKALLLQAYAAEVAMSLPEDAFRDFLHNQLHDRILQVLPEAVVPTT